jgi:transposase-like protein
MTTIRIKVNQPPCAHRDLTLKGRYLSLKGLNLKRSTERYTCNACGKPVVRILKTFASSDTGK